MALTFAVELLDRIRQDPALPALFDEYWREVGGELPYQADWPALVALAIHGSLHVMTAREDGQLVGFCVLRCHRPLGFQGQRWARAEFLFLHRPCRKHGAAGRFISFIEEQARSLDMTLLIVHDRPDRRNADYPRRWGFEMIEREWAKEL